MDNAEALRALKELEAATDPSRLRSKMMLEIIRTHLTDPGYVRVPVEPTIEMIAALEFDGDIDLAIGHAQICEEIKERYRAMIALAATKETPND